MIDNRIRIFLFLFLCIPLRLLLVYVPQDIQNKETKDIFTCMLLLFAAGFLYLGFTNGRMNAGEGGGNTWWAPFRLVHGSLFLVAAILVQKNTPVASVPLLVDVILGIVLFFTTRINMLTNI